MIKCSSATLYIGGVEFGTVELLDFSCPIQAECEAEASALFQATLPTTLTIELEYKGTKSLKGKRTKVKKSNRPLQK